MASEWSHQGVEHAREARRELGSAGPPPDLLEAIERRARVHVVLLELPSQVAGAHVARPGLALLLVNGRQALARQRFTLAHELGHNRMGHATVVDEQAAIGGGYAHDPREVSANAFAAELLMPREWVRSWGAEKVRGAVTLEHVLLLAHELGVSAQAARYALATAGVLRDRRRERQLDDEIAADLHRELGRWLGLAPRDDALARAELPRIPPALRHSALGDLLAGALDVDGLARRLGTSRDAVDTMLRELRLDRLVPGAQPLRAPWSRHRASTSRR